MKLKFILIALTVSLFTLNSSDNKNQKNYEFIVGGKNINKTFNWELFYPTYYLYGVFYQIFSLDRLCSERDLNSIIKSSIKLLSQGYLVHIEFKNYSKNESLQITLGPAISPKIENEYQILIFSNYDFKKEKIVTGEDMKNAYGYIITLVNEKWVKSKKFYNENREKELKGKNKINDLCDMYLYDEISDNDNLIERLLVENIKNTNDIIEKNYSILTLSEYYLFKNNYKKCEELINEGEKWSNNISDDRQKEIKSMLKENKDLLRIIQFVRKDKEFWEKDVKLLFEID